jgi:RNA polymerase sigma factor (sigma-70 family)
VAYRMLGSVSEADDAVQEAWLRFDRTDVGDVENLVGWLTTVVARVCLNMLRTREHRREDPLDALVPDPAAGGTAHSGDPEEEALLAESVGLALLVVLDTLTPAERFAFVLHDMFAVPFDDVAAMMERSPAAVRQLASRARRRVKGVPEPDADLPRQRRVVEAYLTASREGDFEALVKLLDPDVVLTADPAVGPSPAPIALRGARIVAKAATGAVERGRFTQPALINGSAGLVMAPHGRLALVLVFAFDGAGGVITGIDVIAEPERLRLLELAVLDA